MVDYRSAGVDSARKQGSLSRLLEHVTSTFDFNSCKPLLPIGYYANVIDLSAAGFPVGIAFSTDGVGTKILVAEMMAKYDTIGIDCVAMNVNDILCVGATPISMVDYLAVSEAHAGILEEVARGLRAGCETAGVSLSGGELAQVSELLARRDGAISLDIVGTCIGAVPLDRLIIGQHLKEGDRLIGFASNGLHSNGYTLARKILFELARLSVDTYRDELRCTVGEELLRPTHIYVPEMLRILQQVPVKALFHITGDGLFNLTRTARPVGYRIERFPDLPAIFSLLQGLGHVSTEEMFRVFNMGVGFIIAIPDDSTQFERIKQITQEFGVTPFPMGNVIDDPERTIIVEPYKIRGTYGSFQSFA